MTTAVNVAGPAPTRTTVGGQRDATAKGGANADDAEAGFGDVLTKMRGAPGEDAKPADKVSPQAQGNGQQLRDEAAVLTGIESVLESLVQADAQPADDDTRATPSPQAGAVTDIIAAIALPAMHAAVTSNNGASKLANEAPALTTPAANVSARQPHDVQATTAQATADVAPPVATATPEQATVVQNLAAAADAAPQPGAPDKGKQSRKPGEAASGTAPTRTPSVPAADTDTPVRHAAKVLSQEAHFAPAIEGASKPNADDAAAPSQSADAPSASATPDAQPSFEELATGNRPANQIVDQILADARAETQFVDRTVSVPGQPAAKSVLKILHIQLQPADLGTVTVRMELKDAELSLHVEAERPETAELIRNDQDTLSKLLRASGYNVDPASVRVTDADRTAAAQQTGQNGAQTSFQSSPQSHPGASERQGNQQRGNANASGGESRPQTNRTDVHETPDRAGRGLYI